MTDDLPVYEFFDDRAVAVEILHSLVGERISIQTGGNHQHRRGVLAAFHEAEGVLELTNGKRTILPPLDSAFVSESEPLLDVQDALVTFDVLGDRSISVYRDVEPERKPEPAREPAPVPEIAHDVAIDARWSLDALAAAARSQRWENTRETIAAACGWSFIAFAWISPIVAWIAH